MTGTSMISSRRGQEGQRSGTRPAGLEHSPHMGPGRAWAVRHLAFIIATVTVFVLRRDLQVGSIALWIIGIAALATTYALRSLPTHATRLQQALLAEL